jgi:ParB-like chromosome segregation protein Spo0J
MRHFNPTIEHISVRLLKPYPRNARRHSKAQIEQIAASIKRFGFANPVLISGDGEIVAGHGRVCAAKLLGIETVPAVRLTHLSEAERRAYVIADNKLALNAGWDREMLAIELQGLIDLDFEIELSGFSLAEVDIILDEARESAPDGTDSSIEDTIPPYQHEAPAVTRPGDLWLLGRHKLLCGDAREAAVYAALLDDEIVDLICTDPPYNVPIDGHVCGSGRIRHHDFAMGVGEMNKDQFTLPGRHSGPSGGTLPRRRNRLCFHGLAAYG